VWRLDRAPFRRPPGDDVLGPGTDHGVGDTDAHNAVADPASAVADRDDGEPVADADADPDEVAAAAAEAGYAGAAGI
jgi:hypothetical protein